MVNAIGEVCNGVKGLVPVPRSLWNINKYIATDTVTLLKPLAKHKSKIDGKDEVEGENEVEGGDEVEWDNQLIQ